MPNQIVPRSGKGLLRTVWDGVGHLANLVFVVGLGTGAVTLYAGLHALLPTPYLIAAACVAAATITWFLEQLVGVVRRYREAYAYGLAYQSLATGFNPASPNACVQLGVALTNVSGRPIGYSVRRFEVVISGRTITNPSFPNTKDQVPRGMVRVYRYPSFDKATVAPFFGHTVKGRLDCEIDYGHPDAAPVRHLTLRLELTITFDLDGTPHPIDTIAIEQDVAL